MQAVVKRPRTKKILFEVKGNIPSNMLRYLKHNYGNTLEIIDEKKDEYVDIFESNWYKERKSKMTPGKVLRIYRENANLTQNELGERIGITSRQYISDLENGRRGISKELAKKISTVLKIQISKLL